MAHLWEHGIHKSVACWWVWSHSAQIHWGHQDMKDGGYLQNCRTTLHPSWNIYSALTFRLCFSKRGKYYLCQYSSSNNRQFFNALKSFGICCHKRLKGHPSFPLLHRKWFISRLQMQQQLIIWNKYKKVKANAWSCTECLYYYIILGQCLHWVPNTKTITTNLQSCCQNQESRESHILYFKTIIALIK